MKFLTPVLTAALLLTPVLAEAKNNKGASSAKTQIQQSPPGSQQRSQPQAPATTKKNDPCKNLRADEVRQNPACGNR